MFRSGLALSLLTPSTSFESFKIFKVPLKAVSIAIHGDRLMAVCGNTLRIFSFDNTMTLRPLHSYNMSFALSMCAYLPSAALPLACKILLNLLNNGTQLAMAEVQLCNLMDTLHFSKIRNITHSRGCITLNYRDGSARCFDSEMNEIAESSSGQELAVKVSGRNVEVWLNTVLLLKRPFGRISSAHCEGCVIILQKSDNLIAIINTP